MSQTPGSHQTPNNTNGITIVTTDPTAKLKTADTNATDSTTTDKNPANSTVLNKTPADSTSTDSTILCPPVGGSYESGAAAEVFLKNFANANHYALSSIDSKPRFKKWKCIKGPNQKQLLKLVEDPQALIPTCPFTVSAKFESSSRTWTICMINPNHDHGPIPNLKPPKLPSLVPTQPKKRKQRSDAIVLDLTHDSDTANESDQEPIDDYKSLINKLKSFDDKTRRLLIGRFMRDCEITQEALESSKKHEVLAKTEGHKKGKPITELATPKDVEDTGKGQATESNGQGSKDTAGPDQADDAEFSSSEKHQDGPEGSERADSPLTSQEEESSVNPRTQHAACPEKAIIQDLRHGTRKSVRVISQTADDNVS
ncbi:hypothetical protein DFH28DRAFT_938809 [Melampsora americana]|nr:hypothetical protein DFH28DRAFT_938809 [Melampsora americana]